MRGPAAWKHHVIVALVRRRDRPGLLRAPHPHAEDVCPAARLQLVDRLRADHSAIGHDADLLHVRGLLEAIDDGYQRRDIGRVPRPQLRTNRPALVVQDHADDHLFEVGPVIAGMAMPAQGVATRTMHTAGRGPAVAPGASAHPPATRARGFRGPGW